MLNNSFIILSSCIFILCNGGNLKYSNDSLIDDDNTDESMVWSRFLEDYTLSRGISQSNRKGRDMLYVPPINVVPTDHLMMGPTTYRYPHMNNPEMYISKRIGEAVELEPHMRPPTKLLNIHMRPNVPNQPIYSSNSKQSLYGGNVLAGGTNNPNTGGHFTQQHGNTPHRPTLPFRAVTENDLYLLGAIEKLVYRIDNLESQVRRTERLVYYLLAGHNDNEVHDPCPRNFTRIGGNCYWINSDRKVNWKTANAACKSSTSHLAEFEKTSENEDLIAYILNQPDYRGHDFWIGGLNPGLLWIWADSAKPVNPKINLTSIAMSQQIKNNSSSTSNGGNSSSTVPTTTTKTESADDIDDSNKTVLDNVVDIKGTGPCLRLSYNPAKRSYIYYGEECSFKQYYICEYKDKTLNNKIKKIARELKLE